MPHSLAINSQTVMTHSSESAIKYLNWDSEFLGFKVGQIEIEDDSLLVKSLVSAQENNYHLIYLNRNSKNPLPLSLIDQFKGFLVDHKATFVNPLSKNHNLIRQGLTSSETRDIFNLLPNKQINALAIQAGLFSRFNLDPNFPKNKFRELYTTWIHNSLNGELAKSVLVTINPKNNLTGLVTVDLKNSTGQIGLISVDKIYRGKGIGKTLVIAAHQKMIELGAEEARVVTQIENKNACNLYESCGYYLESIVIRYHFWLKTKTTK